MTEAQASHGGRTVWVKKCLLDTGAAQASYGGKKVFEKLGVVEYKPCHHKVRLGDGKTRVELTEEVVIDVALYDRKQVLSEPVSTRFYVMPGLGEELIIGLPEILGDYFTLFMKMMEDARQETSSGALSPPDTTADFDTLATMCLGVEVSAVQAQERCFQDHSPGAVLDPWTTLRELGPEELETEDPLAMGADILYYMETTPEKAREDYLDMLEDHVSPELRSACPKVMDLLKSDLALRVFCPQTWGGLKVEPVGVTIKGELPDRMFVRPRPIRPELFEVAKKEFDRLCKYFYETDKKLCTSPRASPLMIAPKATEPHIRMCGDYRRVNEYIVIPQQPIPIVVYELAKAAKFELYVDLDMTNSFHQIPLTEEFSQLLSLQTNWGLVRPKFLPEGVGPASGILQSIVREIFTFEDFEEWTIVIFDNFLILAHTYEDAASKLERVLKRCDEFGVILKMKKSFIGVKKVIFFGYEVSHGKWRLSDSRKAAVTAMVFPHNKKTMQCFLGAALFFHYHVPNYSEWVAKLYEMTHEKFNWDPTTWTFDYRAHFEDFKGALEKALELHFPDYSLPWTLRPDAAEYAVGAVLFQDATIDGAIVHQPIAFAAKRFSEPATKWDAYKRDAYAIFHAVNAFSWYLRGKKFLVETDHRNLQWIETSEAPIVVRWRVLMQSFDFQIRHIPGKDNCFADWLSRMFLPDEPVVSLQLAPEPSTCSISAGDPHPSESELSLEDRCRSVHGERRLHWGAAETWRRVKLKYPESKASIHAVREWVRNCPMCQKTRDTGIKGLPSATLSLKPQQYRRTVGVDHVTVTAPDKDGNKCVILVVEHFSHFPVAYPAKDYEAETVARTLFKHICTYGLFDQLASDPGSAFMADVVQSLNKWLGWYHKVSLIGRHQSNGCEGSGKQFLRHLRTLVMDERLHESWGSDEVLPLINFHMASFPTSETGGYTPFELKYGTDDAKYFFLPPDLTLGTQPSGDTGSNTEPRPRPHELLQRLNKNIHTIRERSVQLQAEIAEERKAADGPIPSYEPGDLVLWEQREQRSDFLPFKLSPDWLGPYEVVRQVGNDVTAVHVVLRTQSVFHVERLKPFIGSLEDAVHIAKADQHQVFIVSINFYTGNPHIRSSMSFNVTFDDGTIDMPYGTDLASSQQFHDYITAAPELFPLRYTAVVSKTKIQQMNKLMISSLHVGDTGYLSLRFFDGTKFAWYDGLHLPDRHRLYVVPFEAFHFNQQQTILFIKVPLFKGSYKLQAFDVMAHTYTNVDQGKQIVITAALVTKHPQLLKC